MPESSFEQSEQQKHSQAVPAFRELPRGGTYAVDNRPESVAQRKMQDVINSNLAQKVNPPASILQQRPGLSSPPVFQAMMDENKVQTDIAAAVVQRMQNNNDDDDDDERNNPKKNKGGPNQPDRQSSDGTGDDDGEKEEKAEEGEALDEENDVHLDLAQKDQQQQMDYKAFAKKKQNKKNTGAAAAAATTSSSATGNNAGFDENLVNPVKEQLKSELSKYVKRSALKSDDALAMAAGFLGVLNRNSLSHRAHGSNDNRERTPEQAMQNILNGMQNTPLKAALIRWLNSEYNWSLQ